MKVYMITLGCKVNQYESQVMLAALLENGYTAAGTLEEADVVVVNSCTVTAQSDQKVRQSLRRARRAAPSAVIVLTGCMTQAFPDVREQLPEADIFLGNRCRADLLPALSAFFTTRQPVVRIEPHESSDAFESMHIGAFHERTRAFLKIEDGCNRFCSYCIIPTARGRVRSKPLPQLKEELDALAAAGYREVVLVGINLSAYGQDLGCGLCDAVEAACQTGGIARVRLGSLEPDHIDDAVITRLAAQDKLCPQFHLSLQSGCDSTLGRMNRHYTASEYRRIADALCARFPDCSLTTDVMVGFPGEDETEFEASLCFVESIGFSKAHVFAYSRRPGTRAADMPGQVSRRDKEMRSKRMSAAADKIRTAFYAAQTGRCFPVLFETALPDGTVEGYTPHYIPVRVPGNDTLCGQILNTELTGCLKDHCVGKLEEALS